MEDGGRRKMDEGSGTQSIDHGGTVAASPLTFNDG